MVNRGEGWSTKDKDGQQRRRAFNRGEGSSTEKKDGRSKFMSRLCPG